MNKIVFTTANFVARELNYAMTGGWGDGDAATHAYFWPVDTFAERFAVLLDEIRDMGFDTIDLWTAHLDPALATDQHCEEARRLLDERGMRVNSYAVRAPADEEGLSRVARVMKAVGTQTIAAVCDPTLLQEERARFVSFLKEHDLYFAYENHPERSVEEIHDYVRPDSGERIGVTLDTGWCGTQGMDAAEAVRKLGENLLCLHLKDIRQPQKGDGPTLKDIGHETCALGEGIVGIEAVIDAIKQTGYGGPITIEHEPETYNPANEIRQSRKWLESLLP